MAFDQKTRNLLQRTVAACRRVLDREFTSQLQELYGIQPDGSVSPVAALDHLGDEEMEVARLLRERINHLEGDSATEALTRTSAKPEHIARVIREQAFTVLNRLAALRLCEERGLVLECVRNRVTSEGFQLFMSSAGNALGETHEAYRVYLHCLFDELALDLGVVFERFSPMGLLFPRHDALMEVLQELNGSGKAAERAEMLPKEFADIWKADETIGWIYQYYNDETERKKMREESAAPRNSRELAVRNQFFTPRYVVEFLTDNTLGRIWYEMTLGRTKLTEQCRYLVRGPNEIFLQPAEAAPELSKQENVSQEDLLKQPVFIAHRTLKDPRTILMLDPACGSMHFGLYAFDLFEVIYDEAWDLEKKFGADTLSRPLGMKSLHDTYAGKDTFLKDVPRLIIEHNVHGIDIDQRCAQIAGLSLWLRAQNTWERIGIKPAERPAIKRSNIVCAEPMPGEKELLREFVEREFPEAERGVCLRLLEAIFDKMQLAGEAGSLLKIEEEIRSAIEDAKDAWQKLATKPPELFTTEELNQIATARELSGLEQAVASLITGPRHLATDFWERIEERIYGALRDYAEQAENGGGFQRRLFAEDTARGFAFIDVCRKRYDVALMNPPFGSFSKPWTAEAKLTYPNSYNDLLGAFVERFLQRLHPRGQLGAITSRTCFFLSSFRRWRSNVVLKEHAVRAIADLGQGVMDDAMVEAAAYVIERASPSPLTTVFRAIADPDRQATLRTCVEAHAAARADARIFFADQSTFRQLPDSPFVYWIDRALIEKFGGRTAFMDAVGDVRQGLATADNPRFVRALWEVGAGSRCEGADRKWVPYILAGPSQPWFSPVTLLVNWAGDAAELWNNLNSKGKPRSNIWMLKDSIQLHFFRPGFSWTRRAVRFIPYVVPRGCVPSASRYMAFPASGMESVSIGVCASRVVSAFLRFYGEKFEFPNFLVGTLKHLPWPSLSADAKPLFENLVSREVEQRRLAYRNHEPFFEFLLPVKIRDFSRAGETLTFSPKSLIGEPVEKLIAEAFGFSEQQARSVERDLLEALSFQERGSSLAEKEVAGLTEDEDAVEEDSDFVLDYSAEALEEAQMSYLFGCAFGRWDIRYATGEQAAPVLPDPFAPLPVCPPGQLQNAEGLPARREDVPAAYPVSIPWDGILVDDPNHPLDIDRRVREAIEIIWSGTATSLRGCGSTADAIEHEACEILGVKSLRAYFRKPAGFFADHLKRYSKSRRQAPIYWPLSTASGSYTLWIYYHRLTPDTLYRCVQQFVNPKLADVEKELTHLRTVLGAKEGGAKERKRFEEVEDLRRELIEMRTELELWAPKWKPNLNDGVLITAAPLWKLFRLPKWRKDLKACWIELERGDYDWAHMAYVLRPDQVREKCKTDRSFAIAHGLEHLCEVSAPAKRAKKGKAKNPEPEMELEIEL